MEAPRTLHMVVSNQMYDCGAIANRVVKRIHIQLNVIISDNLPLG